jgi:hypothetical protein
MMSALHPPRSKAQKVGSSILPARMHHSFLLLASSLFDSRCCDETAIFFTLVVGWGESSVDIIIGYVTYIFLSIIPISGSYVF